MTKKEIDEVTKKEIDEIDCALSSLPTYRDQLIYIKGLQAVLNHKKIMRLCGAIFGFHQKWIGARYLREEV